MESPHRSSPKAQPVPRTTAQRKADVLDQLLNGRHVWIASGNASGDAHLVPLAFAWDGSHLVMTTRETNKTARNLRRTGRARLALGSTSDVVIIEGPVCFPEQADISPETATAFDKLPLDPRKVSGAVCLRVTPARILAWRSVTEIPHRTVMANGRWLA